MDELDAAWVEMLNDAGEKAQAMGRDDVAEYLRLKATNDSIRAAGIRWLIEGFIEAAFEAERLHPPITVERKDGHAFAHGPATMAGTLLTVRFGVRCLSIEAGWARAPSHGFMRGRALARANISHHGRSGENASLKLVHGDELPQWLDDEGRIFHADGIQRHVLRLLGD